MANDSQLQEFHQELLFIFEQRVKDAFNKLIQKWDLKEERMTVEHFKVLGIQRKKVKIESVALEPKWEEEPAPSPGEFVSLYTDEQLLSIFNFDGSLNANLTNEGYLKAQKDYVAFISGNRADAHNQVPSNKRFSKIILRSEGSGFMSLSATLTNDYQIEYSLCIYGFGPSVDEKHTSLDSVLHRLEELANI